MRPSLVIRGGTVYDGSGAPGVRAEVEVAGDRISAIDRLRGDAVPADTARQDASSADVAPGETTPTLDATGMVVCPGFINVLSHAWGSLQRDGRGASDVLQGVTTEVFGEAFSPGPTTPEVVEAMGSFGLLDGARADFTRLADGLDFLEHNGVAPNVASFVGGHNLRVIGSGLDAGPMAPSDLDRVRGVLDEEMADGALGIGTALIYAPGCFASTGELVELGRVVSRHGGTYISHLRSEGEEFVEALDELLEIGARAQVRTEVYHLKAAGRRNWPKMARAIERIEAALGQGQPVGANMYPYTAGGTALAAAIPPAFHEGGPGALAERLADPDDRARMVSAMGVPGRGWENLFMAAGGGQGILILAADGAGAAHLGRTLGEVAVDRGTDELTTLLDLVAEDPTIGTAYFIIDEAGVQLGLRQSWVAVGSDAPALVAVPPYTDQPTHPRTYGTFARVLGHYARELRLLDVAEAVRRMTSLPADALGLSARGHLEVGAFADIVAFDPRTICDRATYTDSHLYAEGVRHVVVNGAPVVRDGELTGALPGRRLRRAKQ